jgi:hypothetical protein
VVTTGVVLDEDDTTEVSTAVLLSVRSATMSVTVVIVVSLNVEVVELTGVEDVVVFNVVEVSPTDLLVVTVEAGVVSIFVDASGD